MLYNTSLQKLPAGSQTIANLTFGVAAGAGPGQDIPLDLHNVVIADAEHHDLAAQAAFTNSLLTITAPATLELAAGKGTGWAGETVPVPVSLTRGDRWKCCNSI